MVSSGGAIVEAAALTNGQILVGSTGAAPTAVSVSGDATLANTGSLTVASVGTSTAANIHAAELLANAATNANTASTIVKRDAAGAFTAGTVTHDSGKGSVYTDSTTKTVSIFAPTNVGTSYVLRLPANVAASNGQMLTSDTSGNLSVSYTHLTLPTKA